MNIDDALIDHLAELARLDVPDHERERLRHDLERILDMVNTLKELDTDGVEPLVYMTDHTGGTRPDEVEPPIAQADALRNAPSADSDYFKVPKVIDRE